MPSPQGPNILLVTVDSMRADHLRAYGDPRVETPTFDALASSGVLFTAAFSQFPQTNPSHASLFTGTDPATHKLKYHGMDKLSENLYTLAEVLDEAGYDTAGIYSWPSLDPESGLDRGFAHYQGAYFNARPDETDPWHATDGRADVTTDAVLQRLKSQGSNQRPFFLWVHYQDPHFPYTPPAPFDTMYNPRCTDCEGCVDCIGGYWEAIDKIEARVPLSDGELFDIIAHYDGEITFADREIGRVIAWLRETGQLDNTVVVLTADHGEAFGDNGLWFHPWILYNSVIRIPLIIQYPAKLPQGKIIDAMVQSIDVMPSLLELVGVRIPGTVEGKSFLPVISGQDTGDGRMGIAQVPDDSMVALMTSQWKLIRDNRAGQLQLYDIKTDPKEEQDLVASKPEHAVELEKKLRQYMLDYGIQFSPR